MSTTNIPLNKVENIPVKNTTSRSPTIVFIHGNSTSSDVWKKQFENEDLALFHLVAFDLLGHGKSARLDDYSIKNQVQILVENCHQFENILLVGHSLGAHLTIELLPFINNCIGCLIFGAPPVKKPINLEEAFLPNEKMDYFFEEKLNEIQVDEIVKLLIGDNSELVETLRDNIKNTDPKYRSSIAKEIGIGGFSDEYEILRASKIPIGIFQGENDPLVSTKYLQALEITGLWRNKIIAIPNSGHSPQLENPTFFNKAFLEFVNEIS
tara:strand:+ start:4891 stop:5691 length:801 start_codon:yes stop_codon:yes gene_type:complete